jgi:hypothetical protein
MPPLLSLELCALVRVRAKRFVEVLCLGEALRIHRSRDENRRLAILGRF